MKHLLVLVLSSFVFLGGVALAQEQPLPIDAPTRQLLESYTERFKKLTAGAPFKRAVLIKKLEEKSGKARQQKKHKLSKILSYLKLGIEADTIVWPTVSNNRISRTMPDSTSFSIDMDTAKTLVNVHGSNEFYGFGFYGKSEGEVKQFIINYLQTMPLYYNKKDEGITFVRLRESTHFGYILFETTNIEETKKQLEKQLNFQQRKGCRLATRDETLYGPDPAGKLVRTVDRAHFNAQNGTPEGPFRGDSDCYQSTKKIGNFPRANTFFVRADNPTLVIGVNFGQEVEDGGELAKILTR